MKRKNYSQKETQETQVLDLLDLPEKCAQDKKRRLLTENNFDNSNEGENNEESKKSKKKITITDKHERLIRYTSKNIPKMLKKYWIKRFDLFHNYDEGILMDEEGWYSVTPEAIATQIAERCRCDVIIDAFCGVGGNAIQFAKTCQKVIAIDIDETKIICAKNNAQIYGVEDRIEFILGDYFKLIPKLKADVVFLSPPWGGPSYREQKVFNLKTMMSIDGEKLYHETTKITNNISYYIPRNTNPQQLANFTGNGKTCEVQQIYMDEIFKAQVAYYGDLKCIDE
ncbi:675_t:CDS:1 [Diversispora eburnea]|uniref:Trimethylguanosine synthase n=1 Tax=Diversispora eburnea TaxID=1213867 RepID=A0A9N9AQ11_9GLOM|nr:675_t:CDS:1 [Diversispora eburnea]